MHAYFFLLWLYGGVYATIRGVVLLPIGSPANDQTAGLLKVDLE